MDNMFEKNLDTLTVVTIFSVLTCFKWFEWPKKSSSFDMIMSSIDSSTVVLI